jgi:uncharacterized membrane protein YgcG
VRRDRLDDRGRLLRRTGRVSIAVGASAVLVLVLAQVALAITLPQSENGRSVYDLAGIWRSETIGSAQQTADRLRAETGVELAILSIPTGQPSVSTSEAASDAMSVMDSWGVGQAGVNNGIVVLFELDTTLQHGQIYLYGGSGILSTYLSPAALQSVANDMIAKAKAGDLNGALTVGMNEIADAVDHPGTRLDPSPSVPLPDLLPMPIAAAVALLMGLSIP